MLLVFAMNSKGGIDYNKWKIEPDKSWNIDDKDYCIGSQSIKSVLNDGETSDISTVIIGGPRAVYWHWKLEDCIKGGSSTLEFLDNGKPTGYLISSEHDGGVWSNCTYDIKDAGQHELKWVHKNKYGMGAAAWIDGICITSPVILFENQNVNPATEISAPLDLSKFYNLPNSSYSVEIATQLPFLNITLFSLLPGGNMISYGSKSIDTKDNISKWIDKKLYCKEIGEGTYWFEAKFEENRLNQSELQNLIPLLDSRVYEILRVSNVYPIRSDIFYGPNITHVFLNGNYADNLINRTFRASVKGYTSTTIGYRFR